MKTRTLLKPLQSLCDTFVKSLLDYCFLHVSSFLLPAKMKIWSLVNLGLEIGLIAVRSHLSNKRHLVGDAFLLIGGVCFVFYQFFPESPDDRSWYYTNYFYLFRTLRPWMIGLFWSVTSYCYSSGKSGQIIFTVIHTGAWCGLIHYSFFVYDYDSFHSFPMWSVVVLGLAFALGFIFATNHLVYVWEHKKRGNHARIVGLIERDNIPEEIKAPLYKQLAREFRNLHTQY